MHNMKKLILSVFIFTFGFATATHALQVNTLLTKQLPMRAATAFGSQTRQAPSAKLFGLACCLQAISGEPWNAACEQADMTYVQFYPALCAK